MQTKIAVLLVFASVLLLGCISGGATSGESTPTPQASATSIVSASASATATSTLRASATAAPSQVASPTASAISPTASQVPSPSISPSPSDSAVPSPTPSVVEVQMTMQRFSFTPSEVRAKQGDLVRLIISVPSGDTTHGIGLPDFGVSQAISPGETKTVEFTASKTGTFTFSCNVFCGSGHSSMNGRLIVG